VKGAFNDTCNSISTGADKDLPEGCDAP